MPSDNWPAGCVLTTAGLGYHPAEDGGLKTRERSFDRGAVIFREGEPGDAVFLVESGRVELEKTGPDGIPVGIAMIGPFELLGEMGVVDGAPHGATAKALEPTRLRAIPRKEFKEWLQQDPDAAMRVMAVLVERLRAADLQLAGRRPQAAIMGPAEGAEARAAGGSGPIPGVNLFSAVASWLRSRRVKPSDGPPRLDAETPFRIGLAALNNDVELAWTKALAGLVEQRPGIAVRVLELAIAAPGGEDQIQVNAATLRARQALVQAGDLDLLVWGNVHDQGFTLWFTPAGIGDEDRPGSFGPYLKLELPSELDPPLGEILYVSILAAIEPQNEPAVMRQRRLLPVALDTVDDPVKSLPTAWGAQRGRTALTCWGNACATRAGMDGDARWYDRAQAAYRAALQRLPRGEHGPEEALLHRHLGGVLQALGEKKKDVALVQASVAEFKTSVECLLKTVNPHEWAASQNRLGLALYRLDLQTGHGDLLKDALAAFHAALSVFTRHELPNRWAEVMNNMAQVMQVIGDQMKNVDILNRAVETSRSALDVSGRDRNPMVWAATRNALGSALFLLDKHAGTADHLEEAAACFADALEVYRAIGVHRPAAVSEKNLARVKEMLKQRGARKVAKPDWAEEGKG